MLKSQLIPIILLKIGFVVFLGYFSLLRIFSGNVDTLLNSTFCLTVDDGSNRVFALIPVPWKVLTDLLAHKDFLQTTRNCRIRIGDDCTEALLHICHRRVAEHVTSRHALRSTIFSAAGGFILYYTFTSFVLVEATAAAYISRKRAAAAGG